MSQTRKTFSKILLGKMKAKNEIQLNRKEECMVSIKDVARHAGVAISTVSKVVNHYPNVSEATKEKVNKAIEELHFVPNTIASALSSKQAGRVALLLNLDRETQIVDEIGLQYLSGAIQKARESSLDVITVFYSMLEGKNLQEVIQYFESQGIEGIVVYNMSLEQKLLMELISSGRFKMVLVDVPVQNMTTSSVGVNHREAQKAVARKTIEENNGRRILYISGHKNGFVTKERMTGMKELAEEMKLTLLIRSGEFSEKKAREITFQYAKNRDIVVCASDLMAIGAMRALMEMDIFRPVCGFDGITLMGYAGKQMNTVRQDFIKVSETAIEEIQRLLVGKEGRKVTLPYTLVRMRYEDVIR